MFFGRPRCFKKDAAGEDFLIAFEELRNWEKWGVRLRLGRGNGWQRLLALLMDGNEL